MLNNVMSKLSFYFTWKMEEGIAPGNRSFFLSASSSMHWDQSSLFCQLRIFFIYIEQVIYAIHATTNLCPNSSYRRLTHKVAKDLEKVINSKPIWICFFISQCYGKQQLASAWQYSVEPDHSRCFTYAQQIHEDLTWSLTSLIDLRSCPSHTLASFCSQDSAKSERRMSRDEHHANHILKIRLSVHFCPFVPTSLLRCVRSSLLHQCPSPCGLWSLEGVIFGQMFQTFS